MFPLFETIAIENGKIKNIALHQARYERSLITYYGKSAVTFSCILNGAHSSLTFYLTLYFL